MAVEVPEEEVQHRTLPSARMAERETILGEELIRVGTAGQLASADEERNATTGSRAPRLHASPASASAATLKRPPAKPRARRLDLSRGVGRAFRALTEPARVETSFAYARPDH